MKHSKLIKYFAAILFLLMVYWPISSQVYTMKYDMMDWFFPMRYLIGECLQNGVLPVWNPFINLGYPLHADPQSGGLYPVVWFIGYFFGYNPYTINFEYILHILFAFYGMKKLSEVIGLSNEVAILVGVSYACCGFFIGNAQHLTWIISAAWIPYILYFYKKLVEENSWINAIGCALFSFLLLTGGYPAFAIIIFYVLLIAFFVHFFSLLRKRDLQSLKQFVIRNGLFFFAFLIQSLVFLVFFLEVLPFMVRVETLSLEKAQLLPFSPQSFISFLLPFVTGGNAEFYQTDISMSNGYFGLMGLLFLGLSILLKANKKTIVLSVVALFFLLAAMGDFAFLRAWLYHYVPMMNVFRYPSLFRLFALLCFLLLFGIGIENFWKKM